VTRPAGEWVCVVVFGEWVDLCLVGVGLGA